MWHGPRRNTEDPDTQAYYTHPKLAERVIQIAEGHARGGSVFVDAGVGDGALYNLLPGPKIGIELGYPTRKLKGVLYGTDFLQWTPNKPLNHAIVVSNPPFAHAIEFMNKCAQLPCKSLKVVWIVGLNMRLWSNEDKIDRRMHLVDEWLTPPDENTFRTKSGDKVVRTVVQVWERREGKFRALWEHASFDMRGSIERDDTGPIIVTRTNSIPQVGRSGLRGRDVRVTKGTAWLTPTGKQAVQTNTPRGYAPSESHALGTIRPKMGTAIGIRPVRFTGEGKHALPIKSQAPYWKMQTTRTTFTVSPLPAWRQLHASSRVKSRGSACI